MIKNKYILDFVITLAIMLLISSTIPISSAQQLNIENIKIGIPFQGCGKILDIDDINSSVLMSSPYLLLSPNMTVLLHNLSKDDLKKLSKGQEKLYVGKVFSISLVDMTLLYGTGGTSVIGRYLLKNIPEIKKVIDVSKKIPKISKDIAGTYVLETYVIELTDSKITDIPIPKSPGFDVIALICVFLILYFIKKRR